MSTFRGFDTYLTSRVDRAQGDHHYFDEGTLRFFDAYGGAVGCLPSNLDGNGKPRRLTTIVESVQDHGGLTYDSRPREYRFIVVLFTPLEDGGESVRIFRPFEDANRYNYGKAAEREMRRWLAAVADGMTRRGLDLDTAVEQAS